MAKNLMLAVTKWSPNDTVVSEVIIPPEPEDRKKLLQALRKECKSRTTSVWNRLHEAQDQARNQENDQNLRQRLQDAVIQGRLNLVQKLLYNSDLKYFASPTIPKETFRVDESWTEHKISGMLQAHSMLQALELILSEVEDVLKTLDRLPI